jgi:hypothetical protein
LRLALIPIAALTLAACQPEVPVVNAPALPAKQAISLRPDCRKSTTPDCVFMAQESVALEQVVMTLWRECALREARQAMRPA